MTEANIEANMHFRFYIWLFLSCTC